MDEIFNIELYKNHLIAVYRYATDRNKDYERKRIIESINEKLIEVLQNTQNFIPYLLEKIKNENDNSLGEVFFKIDIDEMTQRIHNGCSGAFPCDTLIRPLDTQRSGWISLYLLRKVFDKFEVYEDCDEIEEINETEGCGITYHKNKIVINGSIREFHNIYNLYFQEITRKKVIQKK